MEKEEKREKIIIIKLESELELVLEPLVNFVIYFHQETENNLHTKL